MDRKAERLERAARRAFAKAESVTLEVEGAEDGCLPAGRRAAAWARAGAAWMEAAARLAALAEADPSIQGVFLTLRHALNAAGKSMRFSEREMAERVAEYQREHGPIPGTRVPER
jgi:hypothetical protein